MNREIIFDENEVCDCGKKGAFDFMGDCHCQECLNLIEDYHWQKCLDKYFEQRNLAS